MIWHDDVFTFAPAPAGLDIDDDLGRIILAEQEHQRRLIMAKHIIPPKKLAPAIGAVAAIDALVLAARAIQADTRRPEALGREGGVMVNPRLLGRLDAALADLAKVWTDPEERPTSYGRG